jgi:TetR/AcrR family transcriptional regulator
MAEQADVKLTILEKAREHFSQHGYQGASLKDIAKDAGVASSLINYHFGDKEGLFKSCLEIFARGRLEAINRLLAEPKSRDDMRVRLELFVDEMITSILADPHGFTLLDREMNSGHELILKLFQETLLPIFMSVVQFFSQAEANGLVREGTDPIILAGLLFSMTCDNARKDFIARKFFPFSLEQPEWRKKFTNQLVSMFLNGVVK